MPVVAHESRPPSTEETFAAIQKRIEELGSDDLTLQVHRQRMPGGTPELAALLGGAKLEHVMMPETWILPLLGGGPIFHIRVYHSQEPTRLLGIVPLSTQGVAAHDVDFAVFNDVQSWRGPTIMKAPTQPARRAPAPGGTPYLNLVAGVPQPGGVAADNLQGDAGHLYRELERQRLENEKLRQDMERRDRQAEADRARAEAERRAAALEQQIGASNARIEAVLRELADLKRAPPPVPPPPPEDKVTPLIVRMMEQAEERAARQLEIAREDRKAAIEQAREDRKAQAELAREAAARAEGSDASRAKIFESMTGALTQMTTLHLQTLATTRELTPVAPDDPAFVKVAGIGERLFDRWMTHAERARPSFKITPTTPESKQLPPSSSMPAPATTASPAGDAKPAPGPNPIELIVKGVKENAHPGQVAEFFWESLSHPVLAEALAKAGGDPEKVFEPYLRDWVLSDKVAHGGYILTLLAEIERIGEKKGLVKIDPANNYQQYRLPPEEEAPPQDAQAPSDGAKS